MTTADTPLKISGRLEIQHVKAIHRAVEALVAEVGVTYHEALQMILSQRLRVGLPI